MFLYLIMLATTKHPQHHCTIYIHTHTHITQRKIESEATENLMQSWGNRNVSGQLDLTPKYLHILPARRRPGRRDRVCPGGGGGRPGGGRHGGERRARAGGPRERRKGNPEAGGRECGAAGRVSGRANLGTVDREEGVVGQERTEAQGPTKVPSAPPRPVREMEDQEMRK